MKNELATDQKIILWITGVALVVILVAAYFMGAFEKRLNEERVRELAKPYVAMAVARKIEEIKPKVNAIMEAHAYNDLISAETLTWELSNYLEEGE